MKEKVCRICGTEKPVSEFYFRKDSGRHRSECKSCMIEKVRFRTTGWTQEDVDIAMHNQQGKCAICECKLNTSRYTKMNVDHCHKTGKLRGILCMNCNTAIGLLKESPQRFDAAKSYCEMHNQDVV